jgi:hypothetical protein
MILSFDFLADDFVADDFVADDFVAKRGQQCCVAQ